MVQIKHDYFEHSEILSRLFQKKSVFQNTTSTLLKVVH